MGTGPQFGDIAELVDFASNRIREAVLNARGGLVNTTLVRNPKLLPDSSSHNEY